MKAKINNMISVFDVYELLPHTDCGKCLAGTCMNMAKKLAEGKTKMTDCNVIAQNPEDYHELKEVLSEGNE